MGTHNAIRAANAKGQFILPNIPANTSPGLAAMIEEYRIGFGHLDEDEHPRWGAAARQIHAFDPASLADLAAKMIVAIHYRDPECDGRQLAIEAPETPADRLAVELELTCLDWLLTKAADAPVNQDAWIAAEQAYAKADAELDALPAPYTNEEVDRLADIRGDAIDAILNLPASTVGQAVRKIELAMFDGTMVRSGIDFAALLADATRLARGNDV